jgi:hypothetical protein
MFDFFFGNFSKNFCCNGINVENGFIKSHTGFTSSLFGSRHVETKLIGLSALDKRMPEIFAHRSLCEINI